MKEVDISVAGLGYIGFPTALFLALAGWRVKGYDTSERVRAAVGSGKLHIYEPGLDSLFQEVLRGNRFSIHSELKAADFYFICVPTPFQFVDGAREPDLSFVLDVGRKIGFHIKDGDVVILESTSPVGSVDLLTAAIKEQAPDVDFGVAYCPERVLPGKMLEEFRCNPRIIGSDCLRTRDKVEGLYRSFTEASLHLTDARTAEMCKLVENSFRDVNIAFANELSLLAETNGVDIWKLIDLANLHPRVNILRPGVGVGGHCISVDPWFLVAGDRSNSKLIATAREVNDRKPNWVVDKCIENIDAFERQNQRKPVVAVYGLAFKPDIDDFRESPAMLVAFELKQRLGDILVVEPYAQSDFPFETSNLLSTYEQADIHILLVAHSEFIDFFKQQSTIGGELVLDICGLLESR